jgi:hypothetical protein
MIVDTLGDTASGGTTHLNLRHLTTSLLRYLTFWECTRTRLTLASFPSPKGQATTVTVPTLISVVPDFPHYGALT